MKVQENHKHYRALRVKLRSNLVSRSHAVEGSDDRVEGFSFIEVVMAMTITAFSLTLLFVAQGRLLQQGTQTLTSLHATIALKNLFYQMDQEQEQKPEFKKETTVDQLTLSYTVKKIGEGSALKKIKNLYLVQGIARWPFLASEQKNGLVGAVVIPEPLKKESDAA